VGSEVGDLRKGKLNQGDLDSEDYKLIKLPFSEMLAAP
jgi:hypothetical protein